MLSFEENERLCRVNGDAPMGRMMRRYWLPALKSDELVAGGTPKAVRLLGENLVAFRDANGTVGLLEENCPHRGASLSLARNEDCGLRCIYHGWKIGTSGAILETPAEPAGSTFKNRVHAVCYPVREAGGIVWTYLGAPESEPPLPNFAWTEPPADHRWILKARIDCNWLQSIEAIVDSAHVNYLHSTLFSAADQTSSQLLSDGSLARPSGDGSPRIEVQTTAYGMRYAAIRAPLTGADTHEYVRVTLVIAPCYALLPVAAGSMTFMQMFVPIDDEHTMFYYIKTNRDAPLDTETQALHSFRAGVRPGIDIDANFNKVRTRENGWQQDRGAMERGETFSGIHGVNMEDMVVQESMGPIYDRRREHLGASDVAVIRLRRMFLDALRDCDAGLPPPGLGEPIAYARLAAEERLVPKETPWQTVGAFAGEPTQARS
jgi:phthalate 4,5-dioxygenase oxygenase subunit